MAGISSKSLKSTYAENKKGFNGNELQSVEFSDGSGLDVHDFNARTYDQQIGRFLQLDPLADEGNNFLWSNPKDVLMNPAQNDKSPYAAFWNNPIRYDDPDGECPRCLKALVKTAIKSVVKGKVDLGEVYDAIDAGKTIVSPTASLLDKGLAVFDLVSPVSSKELKAGAKLIGFADNANDTKKALYIADRNKIISNFDNIENEFINNVIKNTAFKKSRNQAYFPKSGTSEERTGAVLAGSSLG